MRTRLFCLFAIVLISAVIPLYAEGKVLPGYDGLFRGNFVLQPIHLYEKSAEELGIMRNEIFAKYGRTFKTQKYRDYFTSKRWYKADPNFKDSYLSVTDNQNVEMILSFEKPALTQAAIRNRVLQVIEYTGKSRQAVFADSEYLMLNDGNSNRGFYGESVDAMYKWKVIGNWIYAARNTRYDSTVVFLLLDHESAEIIKAYSY
ncbi:MAG: YARHG domain-containing protein [Spirochaetales bacterium]|nr:YARHG domain-containing protein [Spirochaetales bacterium]